MCAAMKGVDEPTLGVDDGTGAALRSAPCGMKSSMDGGGDETGGNAAGRRR